MRVLARRAGYSSWEGVCRSRAGRQPKWHLRHALSHLAEPRASNPHLPYRTPCIKGPTRQFVLHFFTICLAANLYFPSFFAGARAWARGLRRFSGWLRVCRVVSCNGLNCVGRVVSGSWQETTGSTGSCLAVSSSAPVQPVRFTRLGQHLEQSLCISVRFRRFGHYPVLACRVERVSVSAGLCFPPVRACRFARFACPCRFIRLCSPVRVEKFPS